MELTTVGGENKNGLAGSEDKEILIVVLLSLLLSRRRRWHFDAGGSCRLSTYACSGTQELLVSIIQRSSIGCKDEGDDRCHLAESINVW
jgi:hypothetical protein